MAARKNSGTKDSPWSARTRERIQTSMLINRLSALVKGEVEMTPHAVTAALGLLRKTCPDLSAQEITAETVQFVVRAPAPAIDAAAWSADMPSDVLGSPHTAKDAGPVSDTKH